MLESENQMERDSEQGLGTQHESVVLVQETQVIEIPRVFHDWMHEQRGFLAWMLASERLPEVIKAWALHTLRSMPRTRGK